MLNLGTILTSLVVAILAGPATWFITNALMSPWVEARKRLAEEKRKHEMRLVSCHPCGGREVPDWFASRAVERTPLNYQTWGDCICRFHDGKESRVALPYEDETTYRKAVKAEAKAAKKVSRPSS
jgi:hypothetical protein